jgi:hypothetical protein
MEFDNLISSQEIKMNIQGSNLEEGLMMVKNNFIKKKPNKK